MFYISTRSNDSQKSNTFEGALMAGMAPDGGLFVPREWPSLEMNRFPKLKGHHYAHIAAYVLNKFSDESIPEEDLATIIHKTYGLNTFDHSDIAPLVQVADNFWIMELFHGPTFAFKDYALQLLGHLFDYVLQKKNQKLTIIGATSGDTGSAAIEACRHSPHIKIFILHPKGRTSDVQRKQMTTVNAPNVRNIALEGTFDDCQAIVKALFADQVFREQVNLSAVNSINWARICAQIVYYTTAWLQVGGTNTPVNFSVPTGNFGNVYAAHSARMMGLPVDRLIIGTNRNDIITRFFETGEMKKGEVKQTCSPSMDIQISSNFERYLFDLVDRDAGMLTGLMKTFSQSGRMAVSPQRRQRAQEDFLAYRCGEENTLKTIGDIYKQTGYILDPHSAVGAYAALKAKADHHLETPIVSLACAHPAKFPEAVEQAIGKKPEMPERLAAILEKPEFMTALPNDVQRVKKFVLGNL
ncbi:MAG: threonine synthase [Rhodospirillales bacterium]|nr:threonine synthase [Rhodospirillales bacterium]